MYLSTTGQDNKDLSLNSHIKRSPGVAALVVVPDGVVLPAVAFAAVAVHTFSVEERFVFAQSPDHAPSHAHLAEHTLTIHLHRASARPVQTQT